MKNYILSILFFLGFVSKAQVPQLKISENKRFFQTVDGKPFFWLGDTGWLLFKKLKQYEVIQYLETRKQQGFNVIQAMLLHELSIKNVYGSPALIGENVSKPLITKGNSLKIKGQYDYWDNVDFIIKEAEKRGIYIALVPVWGSNIKKVSVEEAKSYALFLAKRYKNRSNIIWLNGGDVKGSEGLAQWNMIGSTIRSIDKKHLMTFHPRGRTSSSMWFHNESWLDFNMFQSGHRSYAQDTLANETLHYGEDNWRYAQNDYQLKPIKPTMDGEPSYEDIPYGLHKADEPYWQDYEIRRYAYWSVFAGGCGFTYGHNAVMQFYTPGDEHISYFPKVKWQDGLQAHGAFQMKFLLSLMLNKGYFDRIPDQSLVFDNGEKYDRILATRGNKYALFYAYNGRTFTIDIEKLGWKSISAYWFNPKDGSETMIYKNQTEKIKTYDPPGEKMNGNDWVLVVEDALVSKK